MRKILLSTIRRSSGGEDQATCTGTARGVCGGVRDASERAASASWNTTWEVGSRAASATNSAWDASNRAASATWNSASDAGHSAKDAWSKLSKKDLMDIAENPETKRLVSDACRLIRAAAKADLVGVVTEGTNVALRYVKPELSGNRLLTSSLAGAAIFAKVCGPQAAAAGGIAGAMYGLLQKPNDEDELAKSDENHEAPKERKCTAESETESIL